MNKITAKTITDSQIHQLRAEAAAAGDLAQVKICDRALRGTERARADCAKVINHAARQGLAEVLVVHGVKIGGEG